MKLTSELPCCQVSCPSQLNGRVLITWVAFVCYRFFQMAFLWNRERWWWQSWYRWWLIMARIRKIMINDDNDENLWLIQLMERLGKQVDSVKYKSSLGLKLLCFWFMLMFWSSDFSVWNSNQLTSNVCHFVIMTEYDQSFTKRMTQK